MSSMLRRALKAYQPLYLRGQLLDGPYGWPTADVSNETQKTAPGMRPRQHMLLAALISLHPSFFRRSKS
jgi:hypothetical protein